MDREIKIRELNFSYNGKDEILKNINFDIFSGEFIGIVGRSGSGKSTLLKFLNGLLKSDVGNIEILGRKIQKDSKNMKDIRKNIGIVFQFSEDQFFENSILEDIMFAPKIFQMEKSIIGIELENIKKILHLNQEILEKNFSELSGGEKRRAAIGGIVIYSPKIIILDEPTIGLDSENKRSLMESLKKLNQEGKTIIIISHDLDNMWDHVERIVYLNRGKIDFDGEKNNFLKYFQNMKMEHKIVPKYIEILEKNFFEIASSKKEAIEIMKNRYRGDKSEK
ncbi:MAG: energy-coupling factor ABC transporter ATP-binding protein [Fusobacteriaceae bacterium]